MSTRGLSPSGGRIVRILAVLAVLSALAPLSMDIYIPSLPTMQAELGGEAWVIQASITACLLGIGVGQLAWGPLSDRHGRRPIILIGVIGWTLASVLSAVAADATTLIIVRGLAGVCGAAGIVVARSVVRDISDDSHVISSRIGLLALVTALAPVLSPLAGALIAAAWGWRTDFVVLTALGGVLALAFALIVPETLPADQRTGGQGAGVFRALGAALRDRELAWTAAAMAAHSLGFYAYITTASFIVEREFGFPPLVFALVFGTNAVAMFAANILFRRMARTRHPSSAMGIGLAVSAVAGALLFILAVSGAAPWMLWALSTVFAAATAFVLTGAHSWGQTVVTASGAASALTGAAQFFGGVIGSPLTGVIGTTAATLGAVIAVSSTVGVLAFRRAVRHRDARDASPAPDTPDTPSGSRSPSL
ncbi:multidrug effflux MFS transporter [Microbacterium sp. A204]|uniref:multidrug effflux MFS transporter n=1 Tax=Microbacterium sp. A204 TaxID=3457321 RepID=UPI003FD1723F